MNLTLRRICAGVGLMCLLLTGVSRGGIVLGGMSLHDSISGARLRLRSRLPEGVAVTEITKGTAGVGDRFDIQPGDGWVLADDHHRVATVWLPPELSDAIFESSGMTSWEFANVLSVAWSIPLERWASTALMNEEGVAVMCLQAVHDGETAVIFPGNALRLSRTEGSGRRETIRTSKEND